VQTRILYVKKQVALEIKKNAPDEEQQIKP
jgi:hypothetical protein